MTIKCPRLPLVIKTNLETAEWLRKHICRVDMNLGSFLKNQGPQINLNKAVNRRGHREDTMIVKQKTEHRVITKKVREKNSVDSYYISNLSEFCG